jgi:Uma2 family endonuclease
MQQKIDDYFAFGVAHIWLIDPQQRRAWSYSASGKREAATVLTTDSPRIELPILDLFAELEDEISLEDGAENDDSRQAHGRVSFTR